MNKKAQFIIWAVLISLGTLKAQEKSIGQPMPLFQSDELLYLDLEADFKTVFSVTDDSTWFPAKITVTDNTGLRKTLDLEIRTRGKTRRESDVCTFYPLRLNFNKKTTLNTPFDGQKAIKLVTHCKKADSYEQNTILEYLIYKAYNVFTDSSFKVRPAIINYVFSGVKADTVRKFAFFIEREKHLAERLNGVEIESEKIHPNRTNPYQICLMDMFQYMIGNTDYSIYELHNVILLSDSSRTLPPIAIPYDFDWSGLISATYAEPHPLIGTENVAERVYRGFKRDREIVYHTIAVFNAKKQDIYEVFENYELLDESEKEQTVKYLDEFYRIINNERVVQKEFFDGARIVHN